MRRIIFDNANYIILKVLSYVRTISVKFNHSFYIAAMPLLMSCFFWLTGFSFVNNIMVQYGVSAHFFEKSTFDIIYLGFRSCLGMGRNNCVLIISALCLFVFLLNISTKNGTLIQIFLIFISGLFLFLYLPDIIGNHSSARYTLNIRKLYAKCTMFKSCHVYTSGGGTRLAGVYISGDKESSLIFYRNKVISVENKGLLIEIPNVKEYTIP